MRAGSLRHSAQASAAFTKGRVIVRGKTVRLGEAKKADYILYFKPGVPIAVIEAKSHRLRFQA
jgi:type I site-specific restriction endonuclease